MELISSLVGALVGGLIAAVASVWATKQAFKNEHALRRVEQHETVRAVLLAIRDEVSINWRGYMREAGQTMETLQPGDALNLIY